MIKKHVDKDSIIEVLDGLKKVHDGKEIVYVDMDGVVADFDALAEEKARLAGITKQAFIDAKLYRTKGFYLNLPLIPGAKEALEKLDEKYYVVLLSAPSWNGIDSFTEKRIWVEVHFGQMFEKRMDLSFHKGHYLGHYLIDDRVKYGAGEFMGEHIQYGSAKYPDWDAILKKLL